MRRKLRSGLTCGACSAGVVNEARGPSAQGAADNSAVVQLVLPLQRCTARGDVEGGSQCSGVEGRRGVDWPVGDGRGGRWRGDLALHPGSGKGGRAAERGMRGQRNVPRSAIHSAFDAQDSINSLLLLLLLLPLRLLLLLLLSPPPLLLTLLLLPPLLLQLLLN